MVKILSDVMVKRDNEYKLSGQMELDEGFFTTKMPDY